MKLNKCTACDMGHFENKYKNLENKSRYIVKLNDKQSILVFVLTKFRRLVMYLLTIAKYLI